MKKNFVWPAAAGAAVLAVAITFLAPVPTEESAASAAAVPFGNLPAHFEPGTSPDTYTIRRAGLHLRLDADGADMMLTRGSGSSVLSLTLEGAAPRATRPENLLPGVSNYFLGDDPRAWRTGVPHYARVRYVEVYPGIDLVYYSADGELEYDFLLAPGADAARIRMSYDGAHAMHVDESGDLRIAIDGGEVVHRKPLTYQMVDGARRVVDSAFRILHEAGREFVSFSLGDYDARLPLTIDPVLSYATYLGGGDDVEAITAMVVDAAGAAYIAGQTNSVDFPVTAGVVQPARAGSNGTDAFVAKLNPAGTAFEYVTYLGGAGQEDSFNLRVDAGGNAYVAGSTTSSNFPVTAGAAQVTYRSNTDLFVTRLNATGSVLLYSTYLGGNGDEPTSARLGGLEIDAAGDAYVYGTTSSSDFPVSPGAPQATRGNTNPVQYDEDAFVTRINAAGTAFTFSSYHGGAGFESTDDSNGESRAMGVDGTGTVWIGGNTESSDLPITAGAYDTTYNSPAGPNPAAGDFFVARFDTNAGTRVYSSYLGGGNAERFIGLLVDAGGNAYVAGGTESNNFPTTAGAPDSSYGGGNGDVAIAKLNPNGTALVYSTYFGGGLDELPEVLRLNANGELYVGGQTRTTTLATAGAADTTHNGGSDGFIARLNAAGTAFIYSTYAGGSGDDVVWRMELDAAGNAYAYLGDDAGNAFLTAGARPYVDGLDDYIVKLNAAGTAFLDASYLGGSLDDYATAMAVDDQENLYIAGTTTSSNYPVTAGVPHPLKPGPAGDEDMYIAKFATTPGTPVSLPGTLAFSAATYGAGEAAGNASLTVSRTGGAGGAVSVSCSAAALGGDTATAGVDFTSATLTLNWADGDAANKSCSIPIGNDAAVENAETFTVTLANPMGATLGALVTATVTITDDDVAPVPVPQPGTVQFAPTSYNLNENGGSVTLTLTRTAGADGAISVSVNSGGGSASVGADYTALTQVVSWGDGDATNKTVALSVLEDAADESDESVTLSLSNATGGAAIGAANAATVTIVDNDVTAPPTPPQAQSANVSGRYGGALDGVLIAMLLGLLAVTLYGRHRALRRHSLQAIPLLALTLASFAGAARADDGWYLGARAGVAESTQDAGHLEAALGALGHDVSVSVDDQDPTCALFAGYRWSNGLALETSLFELGEYEVAISGTTASPAALLSDTQSLMADGGRGVSAALAWSWRLGQRFEITPRIGAYYWESRRTVENQAGRITNREFGVDLMGGISFDWRLGERWSLGVGWEAWAAGGHNDVRALTAGLRYSF